MELSDEDRQTNDHALVTFLESAQKNMRMLQARDVERFRVLLDSHRCRCDADGDWSGNRCEIHAPLAIRKNKEESAKQKEEDKMTADGGGACKADGDCNSKQCGPECFCDTLSGAALEVVRLPITADSASGDPLKVRVKPPNRKGKKGTSAERAGQCRCKPKANITGSALAAAVQDDPASASSLDGYQGAHCDFIVTNRPLQVDQMPGYVTPMSHALRAWVAKAKLAEWNLKPKRDPAKGGDCLVHCHDNPMLVKIQDIGGCGEKEAQPGDTLVVADLAWFDCIATGSRKGCKTMFSIHDAKKPLVAVLGAGTMVKGLDASMVGACPGDVRYVNVPSVMGYGGEEHGEGEGKIPPNSELHFQMKMLQVTGSHGAVCCWF
jgi:hypothetical protein